MKEVKCHCHSQDERQRRMGLKKVKECGGKWVNYKDTD
jgi:hypothetical protein